MLKTAEITFGSLEYYGECTPEQKDLIDQKMVEWLEARGYEVINTHEGLEPKWDLSDVEDRDDQRELRNEAFSWAITQI